MNIVVLYYFFSLSPKVAGKTSLFIILFSQITSLITTVITKSVPSYNPVQLIVMCMGGVAGALIGNHFSGKMSELKVEYFFSALLIILIFLNTFNIIKYM